MFFTRFLHFVIVFIFSMSSFAQSDEFAEETLYSALDSLDEIIEQKEQFASAWETQTESLRQKALHSPASQRSAAFWQLFDRYRRVQTDSALHYLRILQNLPEVKNNKNQSNLVEISLADIYGVSGLYITSLNILTSLDASEMTETTRARYYHTLRTIYGWLSGYTPNDEFKKSYEAKISEYRDSILRYDQDSLSRHIVLADKYLVNSDAKNALRLSFYDLDASDSANKRYIYSNLAEGYRQLGDSARYTYYLTLTAIDDLRDGVREYMALPTLARQLYSVGDYERAYRYLTCTMEDASHCKARLRAVETSSIFPIIDRAYKKQEESKRRSEHYLMIALVISTLLLGTLLFILRKQNRKLGTARQKLMASNERLQSSNEELAKTDKLKEDYIAFYLDKCRGYLVALQKYRRELLKLAKSKNHDELMKRLNSSELMDEEQQRFYKDFDESFLNIHPQFVERFNALLADDKQIKVKRNELLTTELRIFALIRLGVTDTTAIARFLNYSTATVYNYRSRIRNNSKSDKAVFEDMVMKL